MTRLFLAAVAAILFITAQNSFAADKTYIIGFRGKPAVAEQRKIEARKGKIRKHLKALPVVVAELSEEEAAALRQDPQVAYVDENITYSVPLAPFSASPEYGVAWGVQRIGAESLHVAGIRGAGIKIGVIDSGIDATHPDLIDNYRGGHDFVFDDEIPDDETYDSHGTHVAGTIAAKGNGAGVIGVAPDAEIYALRVLDGSGSGSTTWLLEALDWAIINGMNVLNISNGAPVNLLSVQDAVQRAYAAGIVIVAAAGNGSQGSIGKEIFSYPALYDSVIAVSATDRNDVIATWSNFGAKIEFAAPGVDITSTIRGGGTGALSGTSMAAPHVAGAAALLLSGGVADLDGDGNLVKEVRDLLASKAIDLGTAGRDPYYGFGLVNLAENAAPQPVVVAVPGGTCVPVKQKIAGGTYTFEIVNQNLEKLTIFRGVKDRKWPVTIRFGGTRPQKVTLDVDVTLAEEEFLFHADGRKGTSATVTIRKK